MGGKLPNAEVAYIDVSKLTDYLMSTDHPRGKDKARFFTQFGFTLRNLDILTQSLKKHAANRSVAQIKNSEFGVKYVLECECETPDNRNPCIASVWIVEEGSSSPRFVTAYPS
jgi:hypothetical protein